MSLLSLFTGLFPSIGDNALKLRQTFTGEKSEEYDLKMAEMQKDVDVAQATTNTAEASNITNNGKGSWRTHIGMTCAYAFRFYIFYTLIVFTFGNFSIDLYQYFKYGDVMPYFPEIDFSLPMNVMMGLLGLGFGVLKTYEKKIGVRK